MNSKRVGVVGLGNMGGRIARRIHEAGHDVLGYDRSDSQANAAGVPVAPSLADVVVQADIVLLSLPDSSVVEPVVLGEDGILVNCRQGQTVVDLSTAAPSSTVVLHKRLADAGVGFVDAGISGGAAAAEKGRSRSWRAARARRSRASGGCSRRLLRGSRTWERAAPAIPRSCSTTS